jgi:Zn-dependent M28 family amino/carboxypeptidase
LGYRKNHLPDEDYIYNGADDNASGTTAVMALAKAFGQLKLKPKRSMLFITFVGEELGLLGSQSYVDNPLFPLDKTVAMLNLDMVGRNGKDTLYIVGVSRSPDLSEINAQENNKIGFTLCYNQEQFLGRSDQASFLRKKIPILFYTTGEESQYHKVTDEVNLIDFQKEARVAQLTFLTALHIANDNHYYKVVPGEISLF